MATVETEWVGACSLAADRWRPKRTAAYPTTSAAPSQYDLDRPMRLPLSSARGLLEETVADQLRADAQQADQKQAAKGSRIHA